MPPKRVSPAQKSVARVATQLVPYSIPVVPPANPPPVLRNPKKKLVLDASFLMPATGPFNVTIANVRDLVTDHTGLPAADVYYMIHYIHVWGGLSPGANQGISLTDTDFGTSCSGDNTTQTRARCGLSYSKNIQKIRIPGATGVLFSIGQAPATTNITARIGVTYWGEPASLFLDHSLQASVPKNKPPQFRQY